MPKHEYPKMVYHSKHLPKIVKDEAEYKALSPEWKDSPKDHGKKAQVKNVNGREHVVLVDAEEEDEAVQPAFEVKEEKKGKK